MSSLLIPSPPSRRLRKSFLVIGIVLLILSFLFFYVASTVDIDNVKTYHDTTDLYYVYGPMQNFAPPIGEAYEYPVYPYTITLQPNAYLVISFQYTYSTNGTAYIILSRASQPSDILAYSQSFGTLDFRNEASFELTVIIHLVSQNRSGMIRTTTTLNHYERPQWMYFSAGVALSSLSLIPIFKSKR